MKIISISIVFYLLLAGHVIAQTEHEKKYFEEIMADTVKNASVVIVKDYEAYSIKKFNAFDYKITVVLRTQYKLKDAYAVEAFSTLNKTNGLKKILITQIKPNGNIKTIYFKEDKNFNEDQPDDKVKLHEGEDELAVEDLEIGDVVDYRYEYTYSTTVPTYVTKDIKNGRNYGEEKIFKNSNTYRDLPDFLKFLQEKYPLLSSYSVFEMPAELNLIQKAINCDYRFVESKTSDGKLFECRIGYVKAYKDELFTYKNVDLPVIKYTLVNTANAKMHNLYPYQFEHTSVTSDEIAKFGRSFYKDPKLISKYLYYTYYYKDYKGYAYVSVNQFMSAFIKTFGANKQSKLELLNLFHDYLCNNDELNVWQFGKMDLAVLMARFCDKIKQPYKMMAAMHKYTGKWEDLVYPSEINWGLYIKENNQEIFISNAYTNSNIYEKYGSLSGTAVILFDTKIETKPITVIYPEVSYGENTVNYVSKVELMSEKNSVFDYHFTNEYTFKGAQKDNIDDNISGNFFPSTLYTNAQSYGLVSYGLYSNDMLKDSGVFYPELRRINSSYQTRKKLGKDEDFKAFLYSEYHFSNIILDSFRIIEGEDYADDANGQCRFKVEFNSTDVINRTSGNFLLLNLGRLITEQLEISNFNNQERNTNFYNSNQKAFYWDIEVDLPAGYKPLNLPDFNSHFENSAGIFNATVTQDGQMLKIHLEKIYTTNYLPKEQWSDFTTFVRQAVLYYEKRLLLEKA